MLNLRTFDLNLLRVFEAIAHDRSVSRAADKLGMSQPAVSNALNRLREQLGDPLFVRTSAGMEPTPKADLLASFINQGMTAIRAGLTSGTAFDPATSRRRFHLLLTDVGAITFLPQLLSTLDREAPGIDLTVSEFAVSNYADLLDEGLADLAIGRFELSSALRSQLIHTSRYVVMLSKDHPDLAKDPAGRPAISYESYVAAPHVVVAPPGSSGDPIGHSLGHDGGRRRVALSVPYIAILPMVMRGTRLMATVPDALAGQLAAGGDLCLCSPPFSIDDNHIHQWWHKRLDTDAGHRWIRQLCADAGGHGLDDIVVPL